MNGKRQRKHLRKLRSRHYSKLRGKSIVCGSKEAKTRKISQSPKRFVRSISMLKRGIPNLVVRKIPRLVPGELIATGLSIGTQNPLPIVFYQAYKAINSEDSEQLTRAVAKEGINQISKPGIAAASKRLTNSFQACGLTRVISTKTGLPEGVVTTAFEDTIKNVLENGTEEFSNFVVENI